MLWIQDISKHFDVGKNIWFRPDRFPSNNHIDGVSCGEKIFVKGGQIIKHLRVFLHLSSKYSKYIMLFTLPGSWEYPPLTIASDRKGLRGVRLFLLKAGYSENLGVWLLTQKNREFIWKIPKTIFFLIFIGKSPKIFARRKSRIFLRLVFLGKSSEMDGVRYLGGGGVFSTPRYYSETFTILTFGQIGSWFGTSRDG